MKQSIDEKLDELLDINNEAEEVFKESFDTYSKKNNRFLDFHNFSRYLRDIDGH